VIDLLTEIGRPRKEIRVGAVWFRTSDMARR
jgi:hypothetical protein